MGSKGHTIFIMLMLALCIPSLSRMFNMKQCYILSKDFSVFSEMIMLFLSLNLFFVMNYMH